METQEQLKKTWVKFYPSYIEKTLKHSEGRKINSEIAVENPTIKEIFAICAEQLKLDCKQELVNILDNILETSSERLDEERESYYWT